MPLLHKKCVFVWIWIFTRGNFVLSWVTTKHRDEEISCHYWFALEKFITYLKGNVQSHIVFLCMPTCLWKSCSSHTWIYYSQQTDIFSLTLNHYILNQLDESICFECLLLAPVKDSPCVGNDCTLQYGYGIPRWFECIISIINTSVAFEDSFCEVIIAGSKSTLSLSQ